MKAFIIIALFFALVSCEPKQEYCVRCFPRPELDLLHEESSIKQYIEACGQRMPAVQCQAFAYYNSMNIVETHQEIHCVFVGLN